MLANGNWLLLLLEVSLVLEAISTSGMFEPAHCHVTHSQGATLRSLKVLVTVLSFNYELSCFISTLLPSVDLGVWLASVLLELLLQGLSYGHHWGSR